MLTPDFCAAGAYVLLSRSHQRLIDSKSSQGTSCTWQDGEGLALLCRKVSAAVKTAWTAPLFGTPAAALIEAEGTYSPATAGRQEQQLCAGDCHQHPAEHSTLEESFEGTTSEQDGLESGAPGTPLPEPSGPATLLTGPSTPCELSDAEELGAPTESQARAEDSEDSTILEVTPVKESPRSRHLPPCWLLFPAPSPLPLPQSPAAEKSPVAGKAGAAVLAVRCGAVIRSPGK